MRKTVAHLFSSVDTPFRFQLDSFDEGLGNAMDRNLATVDAMLLGRVLYTEWAEYRPEATDEFGVSSTRSRSTSCPPHSPGRWNGRTQSC